MESKRNLLLDGSIANLNFHKNKVDGKQIVLCLHATHLVFGPLFGCYRVRCVGQQDLKSISLNMEVTPLKMIFLVLTIGVRNVEKINFRYQEKDINLYILQSIGKGIFMCMPLNGQQLN